MKKFLRVFKRRRRNRVHVIVVPDASGWAERLRALLREDGGAEV